ncbi:MAG: PQQ-binding-like beta-propeller repeat protein [Verrucomicrobiota bacterium]
MKTRSALRGWHVSALLALSIAANPMFAAGKQLWTAKLPGDAKWHSLTGLGTLIVGTPDAIVAFDPDTGQQLWSRNEFKKSSTLSAREVPNSPYLMCNTAGGFAGLTKFTLFQIDYLSGQTVWQTPELNGQFMGTVPVAEKGLILLLTNGSSDDMKEQGTFVRAFDTAGKPKWTTKIAKTGAIAMHMADNSGKFMPTMDLSGYYDPVIEGDTIYLPYLGCQALDLNTGAIKWTAEFAPGNKGLKKTYAPLRLQGDRIYGAGGGSVIAMNKNTGAVEWKSDRISAYAGLLKARDNALVSQIEIVGEKIFARYGGYFSNGQAVTLCEPLGVVALNAADGKDLYNFDKAKEGLTNLAVLPESNTLMFADAHNLYGIDIAAATPTETFRVPIEFKRKMGGGEVAQIGLGVLGGVSGIVKASMAQSKARLDVPVSITHRGGRVVVQGKQHLMCFDPTGKQIAWSTYCAAPSEALGMAAMFAVTAFSGIAGNGMAMQGGFGSAGYDSGVNMTHSSLDMYNKQAGKRKAATKGSDNFSFMLTKVEDGKEKGIGLLGINMANGEGEKKFILGTKEPEYRVDESIGRLFFFKGKNSIVAYEL